MSKAVKQLMGGSEFLAWEACVDRVSREVSPRATLAGTERTLSQNVRKDRVTISPLGM